MSDNGIKAEDEHLQDREEGGDDEVRPPPSPLDRKIAAGSLALIAMLSEADHELTRKRYRQ